MLVQIAGKDFQVWFDFSRRIVKNRLGKDVISATGGETTCTIGKFDHNTKKMVGEIFKGVAFCSKRDQFCKSIGRKVALQGALKSMFPIEKEIRRSVFEQYFKQVGYPKRNR